MEADVYFGHLRERCEHLIDKFTDASVVGFMRAAEAAIRAFAAEKCRSKESHGRWRLSLLAPCESFRRWIMMLRSWALSPPCSYFFGGYRGTDVVGRACSGRKVSQLTGYNGRWATLHRWELAEVQQASSFWRLQPPPEELSQVGAAGAKALGSRCVGSWNAR